MKSILCFLLIIAAGTVCSQEQFIKQKSTAQIPVMEFIEMVYGKKPDLLTVDEKKVQPFLNEAKSAALVRKIFEKGTQFGLSDEIVNDWKVDAGNLNRGDVAVIFVYQPLDLKSLLTGTKEERDRLAAAYRRLCSDNDDADTFIKTEQAKLEDVYKNTLQATDFRDNGGAVIARISAVTALVKAKEKLIQKNKVEMDSIKNLFEQAKNKFVYAQSVNNYILHKEYSAWSSYLLEQKKILFVIIGDKNVLAKANIKVDLKPTSFQTDLSDLLNLASSVGVSIPSAESLLRDGQEACKLEYEEQKEMTGVTFIELNPKKLRTPYTMSVTTPEPASELKVDVHEKIYFGIRVGYGVNQIDRKQFKLDSANNLTVSMDSIQQKELKSNLGLFFEIIPWGRDVNRLQPIWKKSEGVSIGQRIGIVGGIKLSNDPLETFYGGFSFALSREFSITLGAAFHATPIDQDKLPVGVDATLDYLKKYSQKEYKVNFHAGLMMSPSQMLKTLGISK